MNKTKIGHVLIYRNQYELEASTYLVRNNEVLYGINKEGEQCGVAARKLMTMVNCIY